MSDVKYTLAPWRLRRLEPGEAAQREWICNRFPGSGLGIDLESFSKNPRIGDHRLYFEDITRNPKSPGDSFLLVAISKGTSSSTGRAVLGLSTDFALKLVDTALGRDFTTPKKELSSGEEGALLYVLDRIGGDWLAAGGTGFTVRGLLVGTGQVGDSLGWAPN